MACNHRSSKCVCFDIKDKKWQDLLADSSKQEGLTLEQIGSAFNVTRMAICSQEKRLLKKVRQLLETKGLTAEDI